MKSFPLLIQANQFQLLLNRAPSCEQHYLHSWTCWLLQTQPVQALLQGQTALHYFIVAEMHYFWQATVDYMYLTTPTRIVVATSCNTLA